MSVCRLSWTSAASSQDGCERLGHVAPAFRFHRHGPRVIAERIDDCEYVMISTIMGRVRTHFHQICLPKIVVASSNYASPRKISSRGSVQFVDQLYSLLTRTHSGDDGNVRRPAADTVPDTRSTYGVGVCCRRRRRNRCSSSRFLAFLYFRDGCRKLDEFIIEMIGALLLRDIYRFLQVTKTFTPSQYLSQSLQLPIASSPLRTCLPP